MVLRGQRARELARARQNLQGPVQGRTLAFENVHAQARSVGGTGCQLQAQRSGRRRACGFAMAHHKQQLVVLCSGALEAAQFLRARLRQPDQYRVHRRAAQGLLGHPELGIGRTQAQQTIRRQTQAGQRGRKRQQGHRAQSGCTDQNHRPLPAAQQGWQQQTPLQVHTRGLQELGQRPHRPAATGQLRIEYRVAAGDRVCLRRSQRVCAPDVIGQIGGVAVKR